MSRGPLSPLPFVLLATLLMVPTLSAQSIVSARAGAIHYVEGVALIGDTVIKTKFGEFPNLLENGVLRTELGRVEMLLTPGVIVRLAENSALKMISSRLTDARLELLEGAALVEAMEILQDNAVTFLHNGAAISIEKPGLYRLDSDPAQLRVYKGKAKVSRDGQTLTAKGGRLVELGEFLVATKFDAKDDDALYRWSARRSGYLAMANLSAARSLDRWDIPWRRGGWYFNPYFGMFTFVPYRGVFASPFGYSFWSPREVYAVYAPPLRQSSPVMTSGGWGRYSADHGYVVTGGRTVPSRGGLSSAGGAAAPSVGSPRSAGSSSPRSGGGGRGR